MYLTNLITGETIWSSFPMSGWREATQAEIDAVELEQAKSAKLAEMKTACQAFIAAGFKYEDNTFCLRPDGLSNVSWKFLLPLDAPNRFKFCTVDNEPHDFETDGAFRTFADALMEENDRIMFEKYNPYKAQINACQTVAEVEAITIDFAK